MSRIRKCGDTEVPFPATATQKAIRKVKTDAEITENVKQSRAAKRETVGDDALLRAMNEEWDER